MTLRVLVIEDEAPIALLIEDAVEASGNSVVRTATNLRDAIRAASVEEFDVALVDLNLNGQKAHALPVTLSARQKPFAFVTGYGEGGILPKFSSAPVVSKPFRTQDIVDVLQLLGKRV